VKYIALWPGLGYHRQGEFGRSAKWTTLEEATIFCKGTGERWVSDAHNSGATQVRLLSLNEAITREVIDS
jgi:hypothetical protein